MTRASTQQQLARFMSVETPTHTHLVTFMITFFMYIFAQEGYCVDLVHSIQRLTNYGHHRDSCAVLMLGHLGGSGQPWAVHGTAMRIYLNIAKADSSLTVNKIF